MTWFAFQSGIDENALQLRIDENPIKIRLWHIDYIFIRGIIIRSKKCPCLCTFLTAVSYMHFLQYHIHQKEEKIEILLTKDSFAYAVGHSTMLFTQVASIFNISDIANVI